METAANSSPLATLPHSPGDLIRERRIELGLTQKDLSELTGIAQSDISKIENGRLDARWSTVRRLSDALESVGDRKASLASGGYRRTKPAPDGERWQPSGRAAHLVTHQR